MFGLELRGLCSYMRLLLFLMWRSKLALQVQDHRQECKENQARDDLLQGDETPDFGNDERNGVPLAGPGTEMVHVYEVCVRGSSRTSESVSISKLGIEKTGSVPPEERGTRDKKEKRELEKGEKKKVNEGGPDGFHTDPNGDALVLFQTARHCVVFHPARLQAVHTQAHTGWRRKEGQETERPSARIGEIGGVGGSVRTLKALVGFSERLEGAGKRAQARLQLLTTQHHRDRGEFYFACLCSECVTMYLGAVCICHRECGEARMESRVGTCPVGAVYTNDNECFHMHRRSFVRCIITPHISAAFVKSGIIHYSVLCILRNV